MFFETGNLDRIPQPLIDLYFLIRNGDVVRVTRILNTHPEYITQKDGLGATVMHHAARFGCPPIIATILHWNTETIDQPDARGMTPLHYAVIENQFEAIATLLWHGSQALDFSVNFGLTPLDWVFVRNSSKEMLTYVRAAGATVYHPNGLEPYQRQLLQEPMDADIIMDIRHRIYFRSSLLSRLLEFPAI